LKGKKNEIGNGIIGLEKENGHLRFIVDFGA